MELQPQYLRGFADGYLLTRDLVEKELGESPKLDLVFRIIEDSLREETIIDLRSRFGI